MRQTGRQALILTPDKVVIAASARHSAGERFDPSVLAEVALLPSESPNISVVFVVVNLGLLDDLHWRRGSVPFERDADLDRIVVHEVYGHAVPYLLAGDLSGRCADPDRSQPAGESCSVRRENAVRAELGLGRRTEYDLSGLTLSTPPVRPLSLFQ